MALTIYPVPGKPKSEMLCQAFAAGAPRNAEGAVFYGIKDSNYEAWRRVLKRGDPYYFIDNSYFDCVRGKQFRVTKNAFQVRDARDLKTDGKRFANLGLTIKPWQSNLHGHWLIVEQSEVFMRLTARDVRWFEQTKSMLHLSKHDVRTRAWSPKKVERQQTLLADLAGCWKLITHSSAAAVAAALEGIPSVVSKMSAIYGLDTDDRLHYFGVLADNQFSVNEMREGVAWRWLNK